MRKINQKAKKVLQQLIKIAGENEYKKIENEGWQPLSIEKVYFYYDFETVYALSHTGVQNGDLMRDPEVLFIKMHDGEFYPAAFRNDYIGMNNEYIKKNEKGQTLLARKKQTDLAMFCGTWTNNIKDQGFLDA